MGDGGTQKLEIKLMGRGKRGKSSRCPLRLDRNPLPASLEKGVGQSASLGHFFFRALRKAATKENSPFPTTSLLKGRRQNTPKNGLSLQRAIGNN